MFDLTTWLALALIVSIIVNISTVWYIRRILSKLFFVSQNIGDLVDLINIYKNHLKSIYQLEMYHGDATIEFLMSHTTSLLEMLEDYEDIYSIAVPIMEEDFTEEEALEGEHADGTPQINEENVFYAGSRKRDN